MRSMRWVSTGVVLVLVSCGGGSSSTISESSLSPTETGLEVAYKVGDTGPGDGIIVYVDDVGFRQSADNTSIGAMCMTGTCHYLEMARTDLDGWYSWNSAIIAAEAFSTSLADDWILPSKDALNEMCKYAWGDAVNVICNNNGEGKLGHRLDGYSAGPYWSSSASNDNSVWSQYFTSGSQSGWPNDDSTLYVRPVRAF